ncbi:PREDICTED: transmembrane protein 136 isoform X1 [Theobroma cacao]|uniref:Transmembrane protein 136 isoform X1 n=1 Tax=Theobroma cacao TaxID=3641 RepID=A0AB32WU53_THECC|nr:PREDICTED: transmembrane protein 136 isoform X1 [Theobroma cacao]
MLTICSAFESFYLELFGGTFTGSLEGRETNMEDDIANLIVLGVLSWTTAFLLIRKNLSKRSFDFCNRIVSTIHATLAVILASRSVEDWSCPVCPLASKSSLKQRQTLAVTVAYLIYDLICGLFEERVSLDNTVHHLVSIVGIGAGLAYQKCGSEQVAALFITEISSPFLHARELLKELGYRDTDLNLAADITFAVIFSLARMVGGPYLTFVTLSANNPILIKAMGLGLQLVSTFWFYKIVKMVIYKLTKKQKKVVSSPLHSGKLN